MSRMLHEDPLHLLGYLSHPEPLQPVSRSSRSQHLHYARNPLIISFPALYPQPHNSTLN